VNNTYGRYEENRWVDTDSVYNRIIIEIRGPSVLVDLHGNTVSEYGVAA
jgi:hypothetical protein